MKEENADRTAPERITADWKEHKPLGQTSVRHPAFRAVFFFPLVFSTLLVRSPVTLVLNPLVIDERCALDRAAMGLGQGRDAAIQLFHVDKQGKKMSFTATGDRCCQPHYREEARLKAHLIIELLQPAV